MHKFGPGVVCAAHKIREEDAVTRRQAGSLPCKVGEIGSTSTGGFRGMAAYSRPGGGNTGLHSALGDNGL